jgi:putative ABC transport system ATP-binding protein
LEPVAAFRLDDISVCKGEAVLLSDVSMEIPTGRCTALVGPSGAGKSTLLRLLNRFEEPTSGRLEYCAIPLTTPDVLALRRRIVLVAQRPILLATKVADDVRTGAPDLDTDQVLALLARVGLDASFAERDSATLSGGEAQRVCLARALAVEPEVLLLDEPTSSLDAASVSAVEQTVDRLVAGGLTVVIVSHDAAQARRLADQVVVLAGGRVAAVGTPSEVAYLEHGSGETR